MEKYLFLAVIKELMEHINYVDDADEDLGMELDTLYKRTSYDYYEVTASKFAQELYNVLHRERPEPLISKEEIVEEFRKETYKKMKAEIEEKVEKKIRGEYERKFGLPIGTVSGALKEKNLPTSLETKPYPSSFDEMVEKELENEPLEKELHKDHPDYKVAKILGITASEVRKYNHNVSKLIEDKLSTLKQDSIELSWLQNPDQMGR